ncbi:MAG: DUF4097 domain-containing protein [Candidatus Cloacimonetes bacterium]|nr:DUF4097 domain-containing protein [Candidatus Cloacimonadota bacterium]
MRQFFFTIIVLVAMLLVALILEAGSIDDVDAKEVVCDGVRLKHIGKASLNVPLPPQMHIESGAATLCLEGARQSGCDLRISYFEYEPGDAEFYFDEDGDIEYRTQSGEPAMLRTMTGAIPRDIELSAELGAGNVSIAGMRGSESLVLEVGAGDVELTDFESMKNLVVECGAGEVTLFDFNVLQNAVIDAGIGNVVLREVRNIESLEASLGMGNLLLDDCDGNQVEANTGMGNVTVRDTDLDRLDVSSGMGNVVMQRSNVVYREFDLGMGKVIIKQESQ